MDTTHFAVIGYGIAGAIFLLGGSVVEAQVRRAGAASVTTSTFGVHLLIASALAFVAVTLMTIGSAITH